MNNPFFTFETGLATDVGCRREINEDSLLARPDYGLWAVTDGMGGHAAGDFASAAIVSELDSVGIPASANDLQARVLERLMRANQRIRDHAEELGNKTVGATVVVLLVHAREFACLWSGDSRLYLRRGDSFVQISRDHTEARALLEAGSISEDEARRWPRRNVITSAIGVSATPAYELLSGRVEVGDTFLLCSDGMPEHMEDAEVSEMLAALPPQAACDAIIREVLAREARDNVTVVVICVHPSHVTSDTWLADETA